MTIVITMVKLLLAMAIGFYLARKDILDENTSVKISHIIIHITSPCMILGSVSSISNGDASAVIKLFFIGIFMYVIVFYFAGKLFTKIFRIPKDMTGTYISMIWFSNTAFMGYPVSQAFLGESSIFYNMIFNMSWNIIMYSIGLNLYRQDAAVSTGGSAKRKIEYKKFINAGTIASVIALIIFFTGISLPDGFYDCVSFIGDVTPALSMIVIGGSLASISFKDLVSEKAIWCMLPFRLAFMPAITYLCLRLIIDDPLIIAACTISIGMPVGATVAMASAPYPKQHKAAAAGVALSTLFSMITIPILGILLGV